MAENLLSGKKARFEDPREVELIGLIWSPYVWIPWPTYLKWLKLVVWIFSSCLMRCCNKEIERIRFADDVFQGAGERCWHITLGILTTVQYSQISSDAYAKPVNRSRQTVSSWPKVWNVLRKSKVWRQKRGRIDSEQTKLLYCSMSTLVFSKWPAHSSISSLWYIT